MEYFLRFFSAHVKIQMLIWYFSGLFLVTSSEPVCGISPWDGSVPSASYEHPGPWYSNNVTMQRKKIQLNHVLSRQIMKLSFRYSKFLFTRCAPDEGNILSATFHKSPQASQKISYQRLIYLSPTIAMFCGELSVKNLPIKARTGKI